METWATDIRNSYLEAFTSEKVCIRAGPEFGDLKGHLLIIYKVLYGLKTSAKAFGQLIQDYLLELEFVPSLAEESIYMRKCPNSDDHYEYIATYVNNLAIIMKDSQSLIDQLKAASYKFKLKGSGPLNFHLGCRFSRDNDGTLYMNPGKYIDMIEAYKQNFGVKPNMKHRSPLQKDDHPKLDTTPFLDEEGKEIYQSLIGCGQYNISVGRFDMQLAMMLLSRYCTAPREEYLERVKRIY